MAESQEPNLIDLEEEEVEEEETTENNEAEAEPAVADEEPVQEEEESNLVGTTEEVPESKPSTTEAEIVEETPEEQIEAESNVQESSEAESNVQGTSESEEPEEEEAGPAPGPSTVSQPTKDGRPDTNASKEPSEPPASASKPEEELESPEDLIKKLDHEKLDSRPVSECDIRDLIRRGSILHLQRHYGIKETDDLEKLWKLKRSKLVDHLFEPEIKDAESLYNYSNELLDAYKRQRIAADILGSKYLKRIMD